MLDAPRPGPDVLGRLVPPQPRQARALVLPDDCSLPLFAILLRTRRPPRDGAATTISHCSSSLVPPSPARQGYLRGASASPRPSAASSRWRLSDLGPTPHRVWPTRLL